MPHALLQLVLVIVVAGILLWGLTQIPMDATLQRMARVLVIVLVALYTLLLIAGLLGVSMGWR